MFFSHLKLCGTLVPINCTANTGIAPVYQGKPSMILCTTVGSLSSSYTPLSSSAGQQCPRVLLAAAVSLENRKVLSFSRECCGSQSNESSMTGDSQWDSYCSLATDSGSLDETEIQRRRKIGSLDETEIQRRRKIGLANKGKVPWNKGRRHSEETREKIQQRTREALSDPKVRKKMSECPRSHSHQTRAKIKVSLREVWGQRLKWKRSREKIFQLWANSIANAAKDGGNGQVKLDWDSYEKQKRETALQQQACSVKKVKEKELACIRAEVFATERSERKERLGKKRQEQEKRGKADKESKRKRKRKSKEEKEEVAVTQELKLKARLTKIHNKKSVISQVSSEHQRAWRDLDLQFMNVEQSPRQVTLADQIRLAKVKRLQLSCQGI